MKYLLENSILMRLTSLFLVALCLFHVQSTWAVQPDPPSFVSTPRSTTNSSFRIGWPESANANIYAVFESRNFEPFTLVQFAGSREYLAESRSNGTYLYAIGACNATECGATLSPLGAVEVGACHNMEEAGAFYVARDLVTDRPQCIEVEADTQYADGLTLIASNGLDSRISWFALNGSSGFTGQIAGGDVQSGENGVETTFFPSSEGTVRLIVTDTTSEISQLSLFYDRTTYTLSLAIVPYEQL